MSLEELQQNYIDATGLILDRSINPPKVLGQAFLISRNRMVCCASSVYNYQEAPGALAIFFIHANVTIGVRSMAVHPDFDKKAARNWYLAQTGLPGEQLVLNNDIATLSVDYQMPELQPDRMAELNRALSLPFSSEGVESSGNVRGDEFLSILKTIIDNQKEGLLTLFDSRNIPLARIQTGPGGIQKVYYKGLVGELAFFELVYRKPAEGYSFQPVDTFTWGNIRDITAPADALVQEALRRAAEIPNAFTYLGGAEARYQQRIENYDASMASESVQWFAERLWSCIDGYLTLDNLPERAGADTYTTLQAIREMVNKAQVSLINRVPFHLSGQLGNPLVSHTDFEVHAWDPLQAFFLDPLSGRPVWLPGNFFGVANALQPKNMLHTVQIQLVVPGAMILKDYKLIGLHSGLHTPKPGQALPPFQGKIYQMMWMGALLDMTAAKKGREGDSSMTGAEAMSGLRNKSLDEQLTPMLDKTKYVCPNCHASNTQLGPCFNCGTQINPPEPSQEAEAPQSSASGMMKQLEGKTKLNQKQLVLAGGGIAVVLLAIILSMMGSPPPPPAVAPPPTSDSASSDHPNSKEAMELAVKFAGFKATAIPGYWYENTSDATKPTPSFGMNSTQSNQKVVFMVMDTMAPVDDLSNFIGLPPYADVYRLDKVSDAKVDESYQILGDGYFHTFVGRYQKQNVEGDEDKTVMLLVGSFPSPEKGKSMLVVGRALDKNKQYDYKSTIWLCDQMATDYTARGNDKRQGTKKMVTDGSSDSKTTATAERPIASDKELDDFIKHIEQDMQAKLKLPDDVNDLLAKKKTKGLKSAMNVVTSCADGKITKLEFTQQSDTSDLNDALSRAVNGSAPFADPPNTKDGTIEFTVTLDKDTIKVSRL